MRRRRKMAGSSRLGATPRSPAPAVSTASAGAPAKGAPHAARRRTARPHPRMRTWMRTHIGRPEVGGRLHWGVCNSAPDRSSRPRPTFERRATAGSRPQRVGPNINRRSTQGAARADRGSRRHRSPQDRSETGPRLSQLRRKVDGLTTGPADLPRNLVTEAELPPRDTGRTWGSTLHRARLQTALFVSVLDLP